MAKTILSKRSSYTCISNIKPTFHNYIVIIAMQKQFSTNTKLIFKKSILKVFHDNHYNS